jgi:hypothetical protein
MKPAKLDFTVLADGNIDYLEGNNDRMAVDDYDIFQGWVFTKRRNGKTSEQIATTCYDQMQYLYNHDTIQYEDTASGLLRQVVNMMPQRLQLGSVDDTRYKIKRIERDKAYIDMIGEALQATTVMTGERYIMYDTAGKLNLKALGEKVDDAPLTVSTAQDYSYESSIYKSTYTRVKIVQVRDDKTRGVYIAGDAEKQNEWGTLQFYKEVDESIVNPTAMAEGYLALSKYKTRELRVSGMKGNVKVHPGVLIPVNLNLGDIVQNSYLMVQNVTHKFTEVDTEYTMDLQLIGLKDSQ